MRNIYERVESNVSSYCKRIPIEFDQAQGSYIFDCEGNKYLDFLSGCSSLNFGHNDPDLQTALLEHINRDGITHGLDFHTKAKTEFLSAFQDHILAPRKLSYKVQFTGPTGTNAVEAAIKLARKITRRQTVVAFSNGYHGMTMGALACTANSYHKDPSFASLLSGVLRMPYDGAFGNEFGSTDSLELMMDQISENEKPAAFLLETIQGEGGLNVGSQAWLKKISNLAKRIGALLIIDDIQAGVGRSGQFFSFENMDIEPDIVVLAKSISGYGLPMALTIFKPEHDVWLPAEHNGTFRGNVHAMVTSTAMINKFWSTKTFETELQEKISFVKQRLHQISTAIPASRVKGRGMMLGIDTLTTETARSICDICIENGVILETSGPKDEVVKILAPLTTSIEELDVGLNVLDNAFQVISSQLSQAA